ncbi:tRNA pseudouridine(54/55) synthase Pus10 [Methanosalsum natronophilum]|uniref:tRNA pseudouridine synthase Pus10 n=1 Tax=Methanosalsum natronophilum TaxID=768733 RepID=A0A3R7XIC9_9EURY|nr:tRNA pseudouridine(54/55) synthase Pus10 [Methanosalsum natronophilum]MCS3924518.1 tRNA pseudouridine synthase 10 [Methanosalsum natronophilum]RQD86012.1 MAG: tRNA pseudouridine(54/55) synthase Pus10 [Methanosalsum natronophilum]
MSIIDISKKVANEGPICDHCLGRQFGQLSTGLTNDKRGHAIRLTLLMEADRLKKEGVEEPFIKNVFNNNEDGCWVCNDIFTELDIWVQKILVEVNNYEYSTFLVGTIMSGLLNENEEILWAESSTTHAEPLKSELNREIGKLISKETGKDVDFTNPDIVILLNIAENDVKIQVRSIFLYGRYKKLVRGIPQTRWPCRTCKGKGCVECSYSGKQYQVSVDELLREPLMNISRCSDTKFHGAGREDIDALMLGSGRPFVVEGVDPIFRTFDPKLLENEINRCSNGKIEIEGLEFVSKDIIEKLKSSKADKVYNLKVTFKDTVSEDSLRKAIDLISGSTIRQGTPQRVLHRRSDMIREKKVNYCELLEHYGDYAYIKVDCSSGLYVKELVSGDEGRTEPSLSGILEVSSVVEELDVMDVKI